MNQPRRKTIDAATARKLAVQSDTDPRTIRRLLRGEEVKGMPGERGRKALREAGLLKENE